MEGVDWLIYLPPFITAFINLSQGQGYPEINWYDQFVFANMKITATIPLHLVHSKIWNVTILRMLIRLHMPEILIIHDKSQCANVPYKLTPDIDI